MQNASGNLRRDITLRYAYDEAGAHVRYEQAMVGQAYTCVGCGKPITFRDGHERRNGTWRPHFAYTTVSEGCGESAEHRSAVLLIVERIQPAVGSRAPNGPWIIPRCRTCKVEDPPSELEAYFDRATPEVRADAHIADPSLRSTAATRKPDVTVSSSSRAEELYVEVFHTHRVDEAKAKDYASKRWIEVVAHEILDSPNYWRVDGPDCEKCVRHRAEQTGRGEREERDRMREKVIEDEARARVEAIAEDALLEEVRRLLDRGTKIREEIERRQQTQIVIATPSGALPIDQAADVDVVRASEEQQRMLRKLSDRLTKRFEASKKLDAKIARGTALDQIEELRAKTESWPRRR
jgi:hypothetical protein